MGERPVLPGYLDDFEPPVDPAALVEATAWLDEPWFWPAFLATVGTSPSALTAFERDPADVKRDSHVLRRTDAWPVVTLPLGHGHRLHLVWRNFDGEAGVDYLLAPRATDASFELATLEGHFRGPAFSWPEVLSLAASGPRRPAERLLLLLPAYGDAATPETAVEVVAAALTDVGAVRDQPRMAADLLGRHHFWGAPAWVEDDGLSICRNGSSIRNSTVPPDLRRVLSELVGTG